MYEMNCGVYGLHVYDMYLYIRIYIYNYNCVTVKPAPSNRYPFSTKCVEPSGLIPT